jgi:hypothetical protein
MKTYIEIALGVILTTIVTALLVLVTVVPLLIWQGIVFFIMWGWFIVPLGLPVLTAGQCVGVLLCKAVVFLNQGSNEDIGIWRRIVKGLISPLIILSVAAIFHFFII